MHCWRLRERVLDIFEKTTGGRVIFSVVKVGGVVRDIDDAQFAEMKRVLEGIKDEYRQLCNAFLKDSSVKNRTVGVGYICLLYTSSAAARTWEWAPPWRRGATCGTASAQPW